MRRPMPVFVMLLLLYVMYRFNERANPTPSTATHNTLLEVSWTVLPILILVAIAIPSFIASRRAVKENLDIVKLAGIASAAKTFRQSMGQNRFPYLGELNDTLPGQTSPLCAISESGGRRRVAARGVGTPRGDRTVTSASPMPSEVIVLSTS